MGNLSSNFFSCGSLLFIDGLDMKEQKFLPEGYRYLSVGEPIKKGDYFWHKDQSKWVKIYAPADTSNWVEKHLIRKDKESNDHR